MPFIPVSLMYVNNNVTKVEHIGAMCNLPTLFLFILFFIADDHLHSVEKYDSVRTGLLLLISKLT